MDVTVTCSSCGNKKAADQSLAGSVLHCDLCGGIMRVPLPEQPDPFKRINAGGPPTLIHQLAFIIGLFVGLLTLGRAAIIIFAGAIDVNMWGGGDIQQALHLEGAFMLSIAAIFAVVGLLYLFCGGYMRAKGAASAMLVLLIAPPHAIVSGLGLSFFLTQWRAAPAKGTILKNLVALEGITLGLLAAFILTAVLVLLTHPTSTRARAGRFFTLLAIYGSILFALFLTLQGFLIFGQNLPWMQIPAALQSNLGWNSALWIAGTTLLWLISVSVGKSTWFSPVAGLLSAGALETLVTLRLCQGGPAMLARHDVAGYTILAITLLLVVLLACPIALLIKALCERGTFTSTTQITKPQDFVFDM